jgi:ribonuclease E
MANKMLIDAAHPEETRVVVVRGNRIEEFDFESANKKQLRGNIYLAKVTRVEPSLQAAFVEYGGNRHGFLAFSEIHPDYYQIPVADREALIAADARADREADEEESSRRTNRRARTKSRSRKPDESVSEDAATEDETVSPEDSADAEAPAEGEAQEDARDAANAVESAPQTDDHGDDPDDEPHEDDSVEQVGSEDAMEEVPERPRNYRRQYKIQEVIKRRQILLVQVVKEERGNKGAALTTYLSLAGRYSVLMPNTGRGGGISRKITNAADRKRLKSVAQELEVPDGMGVILRTAGASRTKPEIKRDFEYLMRLWENVRELTLQSTAPALVYEEGSLVKRSIRDLYNKDIDEVIVAGETAYRDAKEFMRMLMPSHAKNVKPYRDAQPVFARFGVEAQLDAMFSNQVTLKSGGYLVINQTEALVAIDVNSGRATREHNIEDTALKTNLEAADEVARQLRLRDLAGLVVIDFIDMEESRNNRAVERRLKEALKNDRARIQVGRISLFGLMEMSRQRIRTGVLEGSTILCPHCAGVGFVRATPSVALHVLRSVEEQLLKSATHNLTIRCRTEVALYILNQKRSHIRALEERFGVTLFVVADDSHTGMHAFAVERGELATPVETRTYINPGEAVILPEDLEDELVVDEVAEDESDDELIESSDDEGEHHSQGMSFRGERTERADGGEAGETGGRRRRRRRRRRGGRDRDNGAAMDAPMALDAPQPDVTAIPFNGVITNEAGETIDADAVMTEETSEAGSRRRGRRGGRRNRRDRGEGSTAEVIETTNEDDAGLAGNDVVAPPAPETDMPLTATEVVEETPITVAAPKPRRGRRKAETAPAEEATGITVAVAADAPDEPKAKKPRASRGKKVVEPVETLPEMAVEPAPRAPAEPVAAASAPAAEAPAPEPVQLVTTEPVVIGAQTDAPKRGGWWARAKAAISGD